MTKTKEPKSLLQRWARIVEIVKKHDGPKMPAVLSRTREISAKGMGPWKLDGIVGTDYDDDPYTISCPDAAIAVLEKWFCDDVAPWWRSANADSEHRSLHEPRWNAHRDWHYWHVFVCDLNHDGTHKFKESNTHTDGSEAHIACAEALVRSLEAFHE